MISLMRRLTTARAATIILVMLLFAMASRPALDADMFWHIRLGQQSLASGDFVYADSFSHSAAGVVHKNHSWLAQILMALCWGAAGWLGMTVFAATLAVAGMLALYVAGDGGPYMKAYLLVLGAACAAAFWSPRPQLFTFCFAALLTLLLRRRDPRAIRCLPPLMWLWANLHGGYIFGYLVIAAYALGEVASRLLDADDAERDRLSLRRLCGWTLLSLPLPLINPLGLDVLRAPAETLGISSLREFIQEWQALDLTQPQAWPLLILLIALLLASRASRRPLDYGGWLLIGATLAMTLVSARHISLFVVAALPVLCADMHAILRGKGWVIPKRQRETSGRVVLNLALIGLVALGTLARLAHVASPAALNTALAADYPVAAANWLRASALDGKLFNSYNWGGYLILALPEYPVFIDGRADLHGDTLPDYIEAAWARDGWERVMAEHDISIALIETGSPLDLRLSAERAWRQVYGDDLARVYVRETASPMSAP